MADVSDADERKVASRKITKKEDGFGAGVASRPPSETTARTSVPSIPRGLGSELPHCGLGDRKFLELDVPDAVREARTRQIGPMRGSS